MAKPKILQQLNAEQESKILLASNPNQEMEAATKDYVDTQINQQIITALNANY